jgi:prophage tail gpP-like protein
MPKPTEIAELVVRGQKFDDWESVWVQRRWKDSYSVFRFTAAERDTIFGQTAKGTVPLWSKLQFKPDDPCLINLAGITAITGVIETRQVAYDANNHAVMLIGKSFTAIPAKSSVDTKTGSFDKMSARQIAEKVLQNYKPQVGLKIIGALNEKPFDKMQNNPGELIWDFLERIARDRGIIMGSDHLGNFLMIGEHSMPIVTDLIEGINIKACQCIITRQYSYYQYRVDGQAQASDDNSGPRASQMSAAVMGSLLKMKSVLITPLEEPVKTIAELYDRARNEAKWRKGTEISATITVQGWLCDGKNLWTPGDNVMVRSPMAMLNQPLKIMCATFTQDRNRGTETTLDLVDPAMLNDSKYGLDTSGGGQTGQQSGDVSSEVFSV